MKYRQSEVKVATCSPVATHAQCLCIPVSLCSNSPQHVGVKIYICDGWQRGWKSKLVREEGRYVSLAMGYTNHPTVQCVATASFVCSYALSLYRLYSASFLRSISGGLAGPDISRFIMNNYNPTATNELSRLRSLSVELTKK